MAYSGSCPDMCPEKERQARFGLYMSIFERDQENQPDEYAMIKEYRRSGADQDEPLPEDLRTPRALELTIDYLVCNIMDDSRATSQELSLEWYDFLWDRLRAVRKDITQQNICDQAAAILVERCARFHVHSCYAMNRVNNFDVDMNKRNLNDCLQMLRQMYTDLKQRDDIKCPGEWEFQKYDILLHLNEDYLSSIVLMKTSDHRISSDMKFVTKVFQAYTNNNYYKFFHLMEQADYMTSCLMSLYANKMRLIGLKTLTVASTSRQSCSYPSDLIINTFGFDDQEDLNAFALALDIEIQEKDSKSYLILTKDMISRLRPSDASILPFKSFRMVESKKCGRSIGQLVYGQAELPQNPYRQFPHHQMSQQVSEFSFDQSDSCQERSESDATQEMEGIDTHLDDSEVAGYPDTNNLQPPVQFGIRPRLISCLQDNTMYSGQSLDFCVRATGLLSGGSCQWFKEDELLIELASSFASDTSIKSTRNERISMSRSEEVSTSSETGERETMLIFRLCIDQLKLDDTGRYKCRINNEYGYDESDCFVKVLQEIINEHQEPVKTVDESMCFDVSQPNHEAVTTTISKTVEEDTPRRKEESPRFSFSSFFANQEPIKSSIQAHNEKRDHVEPLEVTKEIPRGIKRQRQEDNDDIEAADEVSNQTPKSKQKIEIKTDNIIEQEEIKTTEEIVEESTEDDENSHDLMSIIVKRLAPKSRREIAEMMPVGKFKKRTFQSNIKPKPRTSPETTTRPCTRTAIDSNGRWDALNSLKTRLRDEDNVNKLFSQLASMTRSSR